jgi:hypothetical protein
LAKRKTWISRVLGVLCGFIAPAGFLVLLLRSTPAASIAVQLSEVPIVGFAAVGALLFSSGVGLYVSLRK